MTKAHSLSGWALRETAGEELGHPVSHEQLKTLRKLTVVGEPDSDGRWPPEAVQRLVHFQQLGKTIRHLPRRVLRFSLEFSVEPERVRRAMVGVLASIKSPKRKMRRIETTMARLAEYFEATEPMPNATSRSPRFSRTRRVPTSLPAELRSRDQWRSILEDRQLDDQFPTKLQLARHLVESLPLLRDEIGYDQADIPVEEQLLLLTVRELSRLPQRKDRENVT